MLRSLSVLAIAVAIGTAVSACRAEVARSTAAIVPTEIPTSTATPTVFHTSTPRPTATPTPTLDTVIVAQTALALRAAGDYGREEALWDRYLAQDPGYVDGYYQRATALNWGVPGRGSLDLFITGNLAALADLNHAIETGPAVDGRYFWRRYQVLLDFVSVEPSRDNRDALMQLALQNLRAANTIGPWSNVSREVEVSALADLGQCQEAIATGLTRVEEMERLYPLRPSAPAAAHSHLANAYRCAGRWTEAISHYEQALALDPGVDHWSWEYWRSVDLYFLGRLDEAREFLDRDIKARPYYAGERYLLRALINYDQGRPEEATIDLQMGGLQSWGWNGVDLYVSGRVLIDNGEVEAGLALLRQAEVTLYIDYDPLLERVRREIREAEGGSAQGTDDLGPPGLSEPRIAWVASGTPMPALSATPTPRYPFEIAGFCGCDWRMFDLSQATGPLLIRSELELDGTFTYIYRFQPRTPIRDGSAVDLTYRIVPFGEMPQPDPPLRIEFYSQDSRVIYGTASWGDNRIQDLAAVGRGGEVTMVIRNLGVLPVYIQNLGLRLVSRNPNGSYLIQEAAGLPYIQEDPEPPPSLALGLGESTGPVTLPPGSGPTIRFSPAEPLDYALVTEVMVLVETASPGERVPVFVTVWSGWGGGWQFPEQVSPGVFPVKWPSLAVDSRGDVVVGFVNQGVGAVELADVSLRVVFADRSGAEHILASTN